jgi:hypothetical protein
LEGGRGRARRRPQPDLDRLAAHRRSRVLPAAARRHAGGRQPARGGRAYDLPPAAKGHDHRPSNSSRAT